MKCIVCQREDIRKVDVKEEIKIRKDTVYLPINIPVCATCGERYYDRRTIQYLENEERRLKGKKDIISRIEQKWDGYVGFFRKRKSLDRQEEMKTKMDLISLLEQKWVRCAGLFRKGKKVKAETKVKAESGMNIKTESELEIRAKAESVAKMKAGEITKTDTEVKVKDETEEKARVFNWQLTPGDWIRAEAKVKAEEEAKARARAEAKADKAKVRSEHKVKTKVELDTLSCIVKNSERDDIIQKNIEGILSNRS